MHRRRALCCTGALAAGLFTGLWTRPLRAQTLSEGLVNPCEGALPATLARHELVLAAFEGIDARRLVDVHTHLLGNGDAGSGCTVHAELTSLLHPVENLRRRAILNAACVPEQAASVDRAYIERLVTLSRDFPQGARWWLFAFDHACDDQGRERPDWSTFQVPNAYAAAMAAAQRERFDWVASVHPYREDAMQRLARARADGAVALKWLPSAMNIDLGERRCLRLYDQLAAWRMPLIVHCGEEQAVPGAGRDAYGNPLHVRHALQRGVTVLMAHAGSLGSAADLDRRSAPRRAAFDLFARLMDESASATLLHADVSAVFQANRKPEVWRSVLQTERWHGRLLHGSDYPLPGLMPLVAPAQLVQAGLLAADKVEPLRQIRRHNALLFDFALKRQLRAGSLGLPASVFEGRALFAARGAPAGREGATVPLDRQRPPTV